MTRTIRLALLLTALLAAPMAARAQTAEAVRAATEGYANLARGDADAAAVSAARAVAADSSWLDYRLLLVDALLRGGRPAEALAALQPVAAAADYRVQTRRAEAAAKSGDAAQAAEAYGLAAPLAGELASREYLTRARILTLVELGRRGEAAAELRTAWNAKLLPGSSPLDAAMLAVAVGEDRRAQPAFSAADAVEPLQGRTALDAAYSARRAGRDAEAVRWFRRGLETLAEDGLSTEQRFGIRREIETLERRWGWSASLSRGVASTAGSATAGPGAENVLQAGGEVWARIGGYNDGRPLDAFVRVYGTLDSDGVGATGDDTVQGWIGLRWKPLRSANLYLEASRMIALGDQARNDTMLRAAGSVEAGGNLRFDRDSWPSWRLYGDLAKVLDDEQILGVIDGRAGWTWRTTDRDMLTAGLGGRLSYDSLLSDETAVGIGPRLSWRRWMGGDAYRAPGSYVDLYLGYDVGIAGGDRGQGLTAGAAIVY